MKKTDWKSFTEKLQSNTYVLPEGWDTREAIAAQLGCTEDNVRKLMSSALKSGAVEFKQIPVWDEGQKRVRPVACYRELKPKP